MRCDDVDDLLAEHADGGALPDGLAAEHVRRCPHCRSHRAEFTRLHRELSSLRHRRRQPPASLVDEVLQAIDDAVLAARHRLVVLRRAAYVGGIAVATAAAGAVGAVALRRKRLI